MSAQEALRERTKKAAEVSREQVYAYIGVNDYWYKQARRQPSVLQELPSKLRGLTDERVNVRKAFEPYAPAKVRQTLRDRIATARERRQEFADRGKAIVKDWRCLLYTSD